MALSAAQKLTNLGVSPQSAKVLIAQIAAQTGNAVALTNVGFPAPLAKELASQATLAGEPPANAIGRLVSSGMVPLAAKVVVEYVAEVDA